MRLACRLRSAALGGSGSRSPLTQMLPVLGISTPTSILVSVDLPEPDSPAMQRHSAWPTVNEISRTAWTSLLRPDRL